jgi:hypothetical protein
MVKLLFGRSLLTSGFSLLTFVAPFSAPRQDVSRLFVSVIDGRGQPVTGLTAADFVVQLDDARQTIETVTAAKEPLSLALLTDRLGHSTTYTQFDVQRALGTFVKTLRQASPDVRIALSTFDGPVSQITRFTGAATELDRALTRLPTVAPDSTLLDAIKDASTMMLRAPTPRRAIFALVAAYRPDQSTVRSDEAGQLLQLSGASFWALEVVRDLTQGGNAASDPRELMLETGTTLSGGMRQTISRLSELEPALVLFANQLAGQYEITYGPGGGTRRSRLIVGVRGKALRMLAPSWLAK